MKKTFKKEQHTGFEIGQHIIVHEHINDPERWFLTIRPLQIHGESLCLKSATDAQIVVSIRLILGRRLTIIERLVNDINSNPLPAEGS